MSASGHLLLFEICCAHDCMLTEMVVEVGAVLRGVVVCLCHGLVALALFIFLVETLRQELVLVCSSASL